MRPRHRSRFSSLIPARPLTPLGLGLAVLAMAPCARATLADGLEVCLDFDGTTENRVAGPHVTELRGERPTARYAPGKFGEAADFRATPNRDKVTDDWAVVLPATLNTLYEGDWSLSFWVNTTQKGDSALIGNKEWASGGNPGWVVSTAIGMGGNAEKQGVMNWRVPDGVRHDVRFEAVSGFCAGDWRHVVATFDRARDRVSVYLDGRLVNEHGANTDAGPLATALPTCIGGTADGTWGASGLVDEVGLWSRVLEPEEVLLLGRRPVRRIPEPAATGLLGAAAMAALVAGCRRRRTRSAGANTRRP